MVLALEAGGEDGGGSLELEEQEEMAHGEESDN